MIKDALKDREHKILLRTLTPEFVNSLERCGRLWRLPKGVTYKGRVFINKTLGDAETTVFDLEFQTISTKLQLLVGLVYAVPLVIIWVKIMDAIYFYFNSIYTFNDSSNIIIGILYLPISWLIGRSVDKLLVQPAVNKLQTRRIKLAMSYKDNL